jgi:hypothetical protein
MNNTSAQKSQKSATSDKSLQALRSSFSANRHGVLSPKRLKDTSSPQLVNSPVMSGVATRQDEVAPPRWPKLRPIVRNAQSDSKILHKPGSGQNPLQDLSSLHLTGDGHASLAISRISSPVTGMLDEDALHVHKDSPIRRQSDSRAVFLSSPFDVKSLSPDQNLTVLNILSSVSSPEKRPDIRCPSILYSQIRNLQKELKVKTEEVEQLRHQVNTQVPYSNLSVLRAELRQARNEVESWRKRAEAAERLLELYGHPILEKDGGDITKCGMIAAVDVENDGSHEDYDTTKGWVRREENLKDSDGPQSEPLGESEGTVRHTTPKYVFLCEDDLHNFREAERALHSQRRPDASDEKFEPR